MENSIKNQNKYFFTQVLLRITYFLLPVVFLLFGCEKDTNDSLSDNSISFSKDFNSASFKNVIPYVFDVDWQNPQEVISDTIPTPFYEFPVTNSNLDITEIQMRHKERNISIQYKVIAIPNEDVSYDYYMVKFTSFSPYGGKVSFNDLTGFSGRISFYDTDGSSLSKSIYDGGMLVQSIFEKGTNKASFTGKEDVLECTLETIPVFTDWYYDRGSYYEYAYTEIKYESKWVCGSSGGTAPESGGNSQGFINDGTHGGGSGGNSSSGYPEFNDEVIGEDRIINTLTGKAKCVYDNLVRRTLTNLGIMQNTYIAFNKELNYKEHFLEYELGVLEPASRTGVTKRVNSIYYKITINSKQIDNRAPIEIARTIIHESIHALLLKHYDTGFSSFKDIFKEYIKETTNFSDLNHSIMRDRYIIPKARALEQFDGKSESDFSYYENLAWGGLQENLRDPKVVDINKATIKAREKGLECN